ncbi:hypothetical protein B0H19DRAFT_1146643 [Mycena capillaripes]|nr:hypothetical protein B0H19DRAFT_1146643 [Mycena capillaripes]
MPSSSITLILCFLAFISGQLFNALCASLHHSVTVKIENIPIPSVVIDPGFSFRTVIAVTLSVLVVHDMLIIVILRYLFGNGKHPRQGVIKALLATVADGIQIPPCRKILLLPPVPAHIPAARNVRPRFLIPRPFWIWGVVYRPLSKAFVPKVALPLKYPMAVTVVKGSQIARNGKPMVFSVPRPFWLFQVLYRPQVVTFGPRVVLPLVEYPTALALVPSVSSPLSGLLLTDGLAGMQVPFFARFFNRLATCVVPVHGLEEPEEESEDTVFIECSSSPDKEDVEASPAQEVPVQARSSQAHLLRRVAAAALLRRIRVRVVEELSYASIEEVVDVEEAKEVLENVVEVEGVIEAFEKVVAQDVEKEVEDETETLFVDAVSNVFSLEEKVVEVERESGITIVDDAPGYNEFDDLPSYEEFAQNAPLEPLFERSVDDTGHAVHRPPSLSVLAAHVKVPSSRPRVSQLHLLTRLSSRLFAEAA